MSTIYNQEQWLIYILAIIIVLYKLKKVHFQTNINSTSKIQLSSRQGPMLLSKQNMLFVFALAIFLSGHHFQTKHDPEY